MSKRRKPRAIRCDDTDERCRNCLIYNTTCKTTSSDGTVVIRGDYTGDEQPPENVQSRPRERRRSIPDSDRSPHIDRSIFDSRNGFQDLNSQTAHYFMLPPPPADARRPAALAAAEGAMSQSPADVHAFITDTPRSAGAQSEGALESVVTIEVARDPQKYKYAGKNSTQVLAKSAEDLFMDHEIRIDVMKFYCPLLSFGEEIPMPARRVTPLVDIMLAEQYVDAYFSVMNDIFPTFIEGQIRMAVQQFYRQGYLEDAPLACCIYLVVAIGARSTGQANVSSSHFAAAWALYDTLIASPYLSSVQALVLMTIELMNCNKEGQAILAIGAAIHIAQSLGLHRSLSVHQHPHERKFVQKGYNLRACVWWSCYCLDKKLSFENGRPSIINDADCDVELISSSQAEALNPDRADRLTLFRNLTQICVVLSAITSRLFSKAFEPSNEQSLLKQIETVDAMLLDWKRHLPEDLAADGELFGIDNDARSSGLYLMHCMYHNAMLVVHRAALFGVLSGAAKQHPSRRIASADAVCLNAARSLARVLTDLASTQASWPVMGWTTQYSLNVIFTLYIGMMRYPTNWICESDMALIRGMGRCFAQSNPVSLALRPLEEMLDSLCNTFRVAQRRMRDHSSRACSNGDDSNVQQPPSSTADPLSSGADLNGLDFAMPENMNFEAQDFFEFGNPTESANIMQLWPTNFNLLGEKQYMQ